MKSKGFVRVLEALLASFIILAGVAYFFEPIITQSTWPDTLSRVQAEDTLVALYKSGRLAEYVNYGRLTGFEQDKNNFNGNLSLMLAKTIDFSVEVNGRPNPIIRISCNCTAAELAQAQTLLGQSPSNFSYKNREIETRIDVEKISDIDERANILLLFEYKDLTLPEYKYYVEAFLARGGTIFMIADLSKSEIENEFMNRTFGLKWKPGAAATTGEFFDVNNSNRTSHRLANYFVNLSELEDDETFGLNANDVEVNNKTVIADSTEAYSFAKVNQLINGRTIWLADYNTADYYMNNTRNLTRAMVLWGSGENYRLDEKSIPSIAYKTVKYLVSDDDPYEIDLIFWRVFY